MDILNSFDVIHVHVHFAGVGSLRVLNSLTWFVGSQRVVSPYSIMPLLYVELVLQSSGHAEKDSAYVHLYRGSYSSKGERGGGGAITLGEYLHHNVIQRRQYLVAIQLHGQGHYTYQCS